ARLWLFRSQGDQFAMKRVRERQICTGSVLFAVLVCAGGISTQTPSARGQDGQARAGSNSLRYRVNYRPSPNDPWQLYSETRSLEKANMIASEVKESGYQAQVVDDLTPSHQPYPDASETSASSYYPTSNWTADYNYYVVPGRQYNYGWYGGWNPWYGY